MFSARTKANYTVENLAFLIKYREDPYFNPRNVDIIPFHKSNHRDISEGRTKYVLVLIHGKEHVKIVALAWTSTADAERLSDRLHENALAKIQKVYQPLGESIATRRIKKEKRLKATKS
jgi:hypothetical protein